MSAMKRFKVAKVTFKNLWRFDRSFVTSYQYVIVTMCVSCIVSDIYPDIGQRSRVFHNVYFSPSPPVRVISSNFESMIILEWWWKQMWQTVMIFIHVTWLTSVTDRQTDRQTDRHTHILRLSVSHRKTFFVDIINTILSPFFLSWLSWKSFRQIW